MKKSNLFKKIYKKTGASFFSIIALLGYLAFLFIPTGDGWKDILMPFTGSTVLRGTLLNQIIAICSNFGTAFKNMNLLHYATLFLIGFILLAFIDTLISFAFKKQSQIYKMNVFHSMLAIGVVIFYIIAIVKEIPEFSEFKQFFLNAQGYFTFELATYMPIMAAWGLAIAILTSFVSAKAKSIFNIIILALATVAMAIFVLPMLFTAKDTSYTFLDFLFRRFPTDTTLAKFQNIIFIVLSIFVLANFALAILKLNARRFSTLMSVFSALYMIVAAIAIILVLSAGGFSVILKNATTYVASAAIAQSILIFINTAVTKNSIKTQVDIIARKHSISKQFEPLFNSIYDPDAYPTEAYQQVEDPYITDEPSDDVETQDIYLTEREKRLKARRNQTEESRENYVAERLQGFAADAADDEENEEEQLPAYNEFTKYYDEQDGLQDLEEYQQAQEEDTDATIIPTTVDGLTDTKSKEYLEARARRTDSVRERLQQLRLNSQLIGEARATIEESKTAELQLKNAEMQQQLERAELHKLLLEEEIKTKQLQENLESQRALNEAKELLESIQREKEQLEQQAAENEAAQRAIEEAHRLLEEAKAKEVDGMLSFLTINPEYRNLTIAGYDEIPLTEEEENDEFIRTLNTHERAEFYNKFLEPENNKIPPYVVGERNEEFFDIIVIYIGNYAGSISFELIEKILDHSDKF